MRHAIALVLLAVPATALASGDRYGPAPASTRGVVFSDSYAPAASASDDLPYAPAYAPAPPARARAAPMTPPVQASPRLASRADSPTSEPMLQWAGRGRSAPSAPLRAPATTRMESPAPAAREAASRADAGRSASAGLPTSLFDAPSAGREALAPPTPPAPAPAPRAAAEPWRLLGAPPAAHIAPAPAAASQDRAPTPAPNAPLVQAAAPAAPPVQVGSAAPSASPVPAPANEPWRRLGAVAGPPPAAQATAAPGAVPKNEPWRRLGSAQPAPAIAAPPGTAKPQATPTVAAQQAAAPAAPPPQQMAVAEPPPARGAPRYYSLHRDFGHTPDAIPIPPPRTVYITETVAPDGDAGDEQGAKDDKTPADFQ